VAFLYAEFHSNASKNMKRTGQQKFPGALQ